MLMPYGIGLCRQSRGTPWRPCRSSRFVLGAADGAAVTAFSPFGSVRHGADG